MTRTNVTSATGGPEPFAVVRRGSADYDSVRRGWNLHSDMRPAAVVVATSIEQVQQAIAYAASRGLQVAAQTTGHLAGVMPDLGNALLLKVAIHDGQVDVDPVARTARIKAGAQWGDVVDAVTPHGLAVMHGSSPSVGVIGYLLAGGLSFYGRSHGLAVNHVTAFEVVTADGEHRRVDETHDPDLFYALRGGGGSFAVVTAVEIGLLPYSEVVGGAMFFPAEYAPQLLRAWWDWAKTAPDSITTTYRILQLPSVPEVPEPLQNVMTVCIDGVALDPDEGSKLEALLRKTATPILGGFARISTSDVVRVHTDPETPTPYRADSILLEDLDDTAIDTFIQTAGPGSGLLIAELRHLGGALHTAPASAGARGHLEGQFILFACGIPDMPLPDSELAAHIAKMLEVMGPWATGTRFASFAESWHTLDTCVPAEAITRLREIRRTVDPDRRFLGAHGLA